MSCAIFSSVSGVPRITVIGVDTAESVIIFSSSQPSWTVDDTEDVFSARNLESNSNGEGSAVFTVFPYARITVHIAHIPQSARCIFRFISYWLAFSW